MFRTWLAPWGRGRKEEERKREEERKTETDLQNPTSSTADVDESVESKVVTERVETFGERLTGGLKVLVSVLVLERKRNEEEERARRIERSDSLSASLGTPPSAQEELRTRIQNDRDPLSGRRYRGTTLL